MYNSRPCWSVEISSKNLTALQVVSRQVQENFQAMRALCKNILRIFFVLFVFVSYYKIYSISGYTMRWRGEKGERGPRARFFINFNCFVFTRNWYRKSYRFISIDSLKIKYSSEKWNSILKFKIYKTKAGIFLNIFNLDIGVCVQ